MVYDDLPVPVADRVGEEGQGFRYLLDGLNPERILIAAEALGTGRAALRRAVAYANERIVFDRPIGQNQGIAFPLAQAHMELRAAELAIREASWRYDQGLPCGEAANTAKYLAAEAGYRAADQAVQTLGRHGLRQRVPRGAVLAGGPAHAPRAGEPGDGAGLHRHQRAGPAEELLSGP